MNIKHPELIPMLVLIPALIAFLYFTFQKRLKALKQLCKSTKLSSIFPKNSNLKLVLRYILLVSAFSLLIIAFISPRWGYDWKPVETKGTNIYIALDISRSMLAEDISPSRLVRAKHELTKLIDKLTGDRVGLIIFAGDSFLQAPLTHDYLMIKEWLSQIDVNYVPVAGTSMKSAIDLAIQGFGHIESDSKAIIIISDGEEHSTSAENQALFETVNKAIRKNIKIYSIGIGTNKGSPIRYKGELVKDQNNNVVVSKLNGALLKEVAEKSGGYYVRSSTGDFHLDNLYYQHLKNNINAETLKSGKTKLWYETYQIFVGIAFALLFIELLLTFDLGILALLSLIFTAFLKLVKMIFRIKDTPHDIYSYAQKEQKQHEKIKKKSAALSIILFLALMQPAQANIFDFNLLKGDHYLKKEDFEQAQISYLPVQAQDPHNPRLNYNMGITHYKANDFERALYNFQLSSAEAKSSLLREKAFYNLGNAHFKLEDYKSAVEAYENALKITPEDEDAQHNLELAKKMLEDQQNPDGDDKGDQDQKDDGDGKKDGKEDQNKDQGKDQDKEQNQDQDNQDKGDQEDQSSQGTQKQPENNNQNNDNSGNGSGGQGQQKLSPQQVENLLKQVKEADAGQVQQQRFNSQQNAPRGVNVNPW